MVEKKASSTKSQANFSHAKQQKLLSEGLSAN